MGSKPLYFAHNCCGTVLFYSPVWERSAHAGKIDSALNNTCRRITGYLKPSPLNKVYSLAGIALPLSIRREVSSQSERQKCNLDERHPMYGLTAAPSRLKSRKSYLKTVPPLDEHTTHQLKTQNLWQNYTNNIPDQHKLQISQFKNLSLQDTSYNGINDVVSTV